ncbi:unnamed protein product [Prorocentrum cordatum]|uniref:Uncharacterized protein n=1 Tax=Prorocentrum cordatum TaxID=2364126 RepID=A0ABN9QA72_9DINO|nr:unnamed protein product [Polarella glacialis]
MHHHAVGTVRKWKLFSADVKSAFVQADNAESRGLKLRAAPTKEMREMLLQQIGLEPGQLLKLIKPSFGDPGSPKLWHYRSGEVTKEVGDDPFDICAIDGQNYAVDGLIGKHVGDFLGCGENLKTEGDMHAPVDDPESFKLTFTGGELDQNVNAYATALRFEKYLHAVKPITIDKVRRASSASPLAPKELTSFRTLSGQLQWPAAQGIIIAAAVVSFWAAATGNATAQDMIDANKDLRFLKANADVGLRFGFDKPWSAMRTGACSDASCASRPGGGSQGGCRIFIGPAEELEAGTLAPIVAREWDPKKLRRLCRSSLSAEVQAAALGVDSLMRVKIYVALSQSPFIADAKCIHGASRSVTAGLGVAEKRAAGGVRVVSERMKEIDAVWRWVNMQQQLADGHNYHHDPNFAAGRKLSKMQVELRGQELEQAGDELAGNTETTEQPKQRARRGHYGASGGRLAATLAAGAASGSQGRNARTPMDLGGGAWDLWNFLVFVLVLSLGIGLAIGHCMGRKVGATLAQQKMESPMDAARRQKRHGQCLTEDGNEQWDDENDYEVNHLRRCTDAWTDSDVREPLQLALPARVPAVRPPRLLGFLGVSTPLPRVAGGSTGERLAWWPCVVWADLPALVKQLRDSFIVVPVVGSDYREAMLRAEAGRGAAAVAGAARQPLYQTLPRGTLVGAGQASGIGIGFPDLRWLVLVAGLLALASCGCLGAVWGGLGRPDRRKQAASQKSDTQPSIANREMNVGTLAQELDRAPSAAFAGLRWLRRRLRQCRASGSRWGFGAVEYNVPGAPLFHERGTCGTATLAGADEVAVFVNRFQRVLTPAVFAVEKAEVLLPLPRRLLGLAHLRPESAEVSGCWPLPLVQLQGFQEQEARSPRAALELPLPPRQPCRRWALRCPRGRSWRPRCQVWATVVCWCLLSEALCSLQPSGPPRQTTHGRRARWKADAKLQDNDGGVENHLMNCQMLESKATFGQCSLPDIAAAEIMSRSVQLSEERRRDRVPTLSGGGGDAAQDAFRRMGLGRSRGKVTARPAPQFWASLELQKEASVMTERRKDREERASAKATNKANKDERDDG